MNFYPFFEKSYQNSKNLLLFCIANSGIFVTGLLFLLGWITWYDSFFQLLRHTLQGTHISGETAGQLINQLYHIGTIAVFITPLILLIWRLSVTFTYARLNVLETSRPAWHIFIFDLAKFITLLLMIFLTHYSLSTGAWLAIAIEIVLTLGILSFIHFYEIIYFSSTHNHHLKTLAKAWFQHGSNILFLHAIDIAVLLVGFCLLGVLIAAFTYLPFVLAAIILISLLFVWGKLILIWKGFWSYASYALITQS